VDHPDFATNGDRVQHQEELRREVETRTVEHPTDDWIERLQSHGLPCGPIQPIGDALDSDQTAALGLVVDVAHPGSGSYRSLRNPLRMGGEAMPPRAGPPRLGQHTADVLATLGYDDDEIARLASGGAIALEGS
jgi:formyl-CoA transferase/CoA:oxalate CoA-transferase